MRCFLQKSNENLKLRVKRKKKNTNMEHRIFRAMILFYRYCYGGHMSKPSVFLSV